MIVNIGMRDLTKLIKIVRGLEEQLIFYKCTSIIEGNRIIYRDKDGNIIRTMSVEKDNDYHR